MKHRKQGRFRFHGVQQTDELVALLEQLTEGLRNGKLDLSAGTEHISLMPQSPIFVEVEAESSMQDQEFKLLVRWNHQLPTLGALNLRIESSTPTTEPE